MVETKVRENRCESENRRKWCNAEVGGVMWDWNGTGPPPAAVVPRVG